MGSVRVRVSDRPILAPPGRLSRCCSFRRAPPTVHPRREFDADLEVGRALRPDRDDVAGTRIPSLVRPVASDLEDSEPTKFDFLAAAYGLLQAAEDHIDQQLRTRPRELELVGDDGRTSGVPRSFDKASAL